MTIHFLVRKIKQNRYMKLVIFENQSKKQTKSSIRFV